MCESLKIHCINTGTDISLAGGESLLEIAGKIGFENLGLKFRPICALVNNKTEPLDYRVFTPKQVRFVDRSAASAFRCYTRSLSMMLYVAVREVLPGVVLRIEHSLAGGWYCRLFSVSGEGDARREELLEITQTMLDKLLDSMRRLHARALPFVSSERLTDDVRAEFLREGLVDKVRLLDTLHQLYTVVYTLDGVTDSYYGVLAPSTADIDIFSLRPYKEGFVMQGVDRFDPSQPARFNPQEKMYGAFNENLRFNRIIGVDDVGELNEAVLTDSTARLINVAEALHDKKIASIADEIARRYREGGARVVLVAGPSSSGKTTFTKRLAIYLMTNLLQPRMISLDNYFVNRDCTPRDADGEYDYESLHALDLAQFNSDLKRLLAGEEVEIPTYNFEKGCRQYKGDRLRLGEGTVLLMEGIHGLNPELTAEVPDPMKYRVYVSALTTLSIDDHNWIPTTDNRLLRRMVRDNATRGHNAQATLARWESVRRGEEKHIFPYQENADVMFNSSLFYEISVLRPYAERILREVPDTVPEYGEAKRLLKFLDNFIPIDPAEIPPTSLLREFIGGSSFRY